MSNHLKNQSSPYLLQHAENPVDWYPWQKEAFEKAKREDKPIFLSVGYSTCHWCHVMAHESFENPEIAEILNDNFISIKVDREERPDIDSVYMTVCQAMTGRGGWPMSVFLTADQKPFFAGTYFPAYSKDGQLGFRELLLAVTAKWQSGKEDLLKSGEAFFHTLNNQVLESSDEIDGALPEAAVAIFSQIFDRQYGGFGPAPKFPIPHNLLFLTLYGQLKNDKTALLMAKQTLLAMRRGGLYDQIGSGFSRYSTDAVFLAPHFEKMLYDNALLMMAYAAMHKITDIKLFLDTAERTAAYVLREMTSDEGAFYSAQDADSEGVEGKFYVWDYDEICNALGEEKGRRFCAHFGVTKEGNFEGKNILHLLNSELSDAFESEIEQLYQIRKKRGQLHLDDKILLSWNALMICAMSVLYRVSADEKYLAAAVRDYQYIEQNLISENTLYVSVRKQTRSVKGFLDEYAYYTAALLFLYEATFENGYLERAQEICRQANEQFADLEGGGYFLYGRQNSALIARPKETFDGALPSGNSVMAYCLVRLAQYTGEQEFETAAKRQLAFLSAQSKDYPAGHSLFLIALLLDQNPVKITAVCAKEDDRKEILRRLPLYAQIEIILDGQNGYKLLNGRTTYYICKNHICYPPTNECQI